MTRIAILCTVAMLAGCAVTPTPQQAAATGAVVTLAGVAAAQNTTVASLVNKGNLFCSQKVALGAPLVVALANMAGAPVSVTGMAAADVATACGLIGAIPVAPPADPASVPVVAAPVAVLPAAMTVSSISVTIPHGGSISARADLQQSCVISEHLISGCALSDGASISIPGVVASK